MKLDSWVFIVNDVIPYPQSTSATLHVGVVTLYCRLRACGTCSSVRHRTGDRSLVKKRGVIYDLQTCE